MCGTDTSSTWSPARAARSSMSSSRPAIRRRRALPAYARARDRPLRRAAAAGRRRWRLCQPGQSHSGQGAWRQGCRLPQEARPGGQRHGQEPLVYRKLRNFRAAIEAGISCLKRAYGFGTLHLARARSLQDRHLIRGGGAQPGPARPPQTGIDPPPRPAASMTIDQIKSTLARQTILSTPAATSTRRRRAPDENRPLRPSTPLKKRAFMDGH